MPFQRLTSSARPSLAPRSLLVAGLLCLGATACAPPEAPAASDTPMEAELQPRPELPEFRVYGEPPSSEDDEAIGALFGEFSTAWASSDAAGVAAHYADDAEWTNAFGEVVRGPADLESFLTRMFADFDTSVSEGEQSNVQSVSMRYLGDDAAVFHGATTSNRGVDAGEPDDRRVHSTFVLAKRDGTWKIVHHVIMDARR